jgi:rubredoxin
MRHKLVPIGEDSFKCEHCGLVCDITDGPEPDEYCPGSAAAQEDVIHGEE